MIELLLVITILGVLAATVFFALSNAIGSASQASCNADAKTVQEAVQAFHDNSRNTADPNGWPTATAQLTDSPASNFGGPYLSSWPSSSHYNIYLGDGVTSDAAGNTTQPGEVLVGPPLATGVADSLDFNSSPNPCNASDIS
jgi:type II secretory pathway pseudopilin PulG